MGHRAAACLLLASVGLALARPVAAAEVRILALDGDGPPAAAGEARDRPAADLVVALGAGGRVGPDAVSGFGWRDTKAPRDALAARIAGGARVVGANVAAPGLAAPAVARVEIAGAVALVAGVSEPPPPLDLLPELSRALEGVRFAPAGEALKKALAEATPEDLVVVLAVMGPEAAAEVLEAIPAIDVVFCRADAGKLPPRRIGEGWLVTVPSGETGVLARLQVEQGRVEKLEEQPVALSAARAELPPPLKLPATGTTARVPARLAPGETAPLAQRAANAAAELEVLSAALLPRFGDLVPPPRSALLVLDTRWKNTIPLKRIQEHNLPTRYVAPDLDLALCVVLDGREVFTLHPRATGAPGHLPVKPLSLPQLGSTERGVLAFVVPARPIERAGFRLYDYAYGSLRVPLAGPGGDAPAPPAPLVEPVRTEGFEVAVAGIERLPDSPEGPALAVDVALRCLVTTTMSGRAAGLDREKVEVACVAPLDGLEETYVLVADRDVFRVRQAPAAVRVLPDLAGRHRVVFPAPRDGVRSIALVVHIGRFAGPDGTVRTAAPLWIQLEGQADASVREKALADVAAGRVPDLGGGGAPPVQPPIVGAPETPEVPPAEDPARRAAERERRTAEVLAGLDASDGHLRARDVGKAIAGARAAQDRAAELAVALPEARALASRLEALAAAHVAVAEGIQRHQAGTPGLAAAHFEEATRLAAAAAGSDEVGIRAERLKRKAEDLRARVGR